MNNRKLNTYASGDGALSLVWLRRNHANGQDVATGQPVSLDDAQRAIHAKNKHVGRCLADEGWKILKTGPIVKNGKRVAGPWFKLFRAMMRIGVEETRYAVIGSTGVLEMSDGIRVKYAVVRRVEDNSVAQLWLTNADNDGIKNVNTIAAVKFWLNNEKEIASGTVEPKRRESAQDRLKAFRKTRNAEVEALAAELN